jgi:hypothetical protein
MATVVLENTSPLLEEVPSVSATEFTEMQTEIESQPLGRVKKPWFLKTEEIYEVVKNAAVDIKVGDVVLAERAITVVDGFAVAITKKVLRVSEVEGFSIVKKMDELTIRILRNVDAGLDVFSVKFVEAVGALQSAVLTHAEWTNNAVKQRAIEARALSDQLIAQMQETEQYKRIKTSVDPAIGTITTAYGSVDTTVRAFLTRMETDYPDAAARVKSLIVLPHPELLSASSIISSVNEKVYKPALAGATTVYNTAVDTAIPACVSGATVAYNTAKPACISGATAVYNGASPVVSQLYATALPVVAQLMERAQPYVHRAIDVSSPYVNRAMEISKPAIDVALDMSMPVIDRLAEVSSPYVTPALANPIVQQTIASSVVAVDAVKRYCQKPVGSTEDGVELVLEPPGYSAPSSSSSIAPVCDTANDASSTTVENSADGASVSVAVAATTCGVVSSGSTTTCAGEDDVSLPIERVNVTTPVNFHRESGEEVDKVQVKSQAESSSTGDGTADDTELAPPPYTPGGDTNDGGGGTVASESVSDDGPAETSETVATSSPGEKKGKKGKKNKGNQ